jgi:hypothetical protein
LNDVYVTAVGPKGYWIADSPIAASKGGVFVFLNAAPTVTVGQQFDHVQGIATAFNGSSATSGTKSVIQITNATAGTELATGTSFTPITTATLATLTDLTNGEPFAGSLVQLQLLKVKTVTEHQVTLVDNSNATIIMSDGAFAGFGGTAPVGDDCYTTLTGVMDFNTFNDPQIRTLNPTSTADMAKGTGCTGM